LLEIRKDLVITGVYEKLGGSEIFPCLTLSPLDPQLTEARKVVQQKKLEKIAEVKRKQEEQQANGEKVLPNWRV
jgi:hypothetical protein